jgi:hypothetical protein
MLEIGRRSNFLPNLKDIPVTMVAPTAYLELKLLDFFAVLFFLLFDVPLIFKF